MREEHITTNSRVCLRHFPSRDVLKSPAMTLSKQFASPTCIKKGERASHSAIRAIVHTEIDVSHELFGLFTRVKALRVWPDLKFSPGLAFK